MKHALVATLLLFGGLTAGCGGGDGDPAADASPSTSSSPSAASSGTSAPADSADSLCQVLTSTTEISTGVQIATLARSLSSVGTIADMTASQARGLELYVGALDAVDPAATEEEVAAITDLGLSTAQESKVEDFFTYASTACAPAGSATADTSGSATADAG